jgi:hypothetical protein
MAVTKRIFEVCKDYFNDPSKKIAELGSQYVMEGDWGGYGPPFFKNIFSNLDITSFDFVIENDCKFLDLTKELPIEYKEQYDIVTNFGTTEHVQVQHICWKNVFDMTKPGGIVINTIPKKGSWVNHCKYYFDESSFESMSSDFEIIEMKDIIDNENGALIYCVQKRINDGEFKTTEDKLMKTVDVDHSYVDHIGH